MAPAGLYGDAEDEEVKEPVIQDEFAMPALAEQSAESWVHHYPIILKAGRITHIADAGLNEEDAEAQIGEKEEADPTCDRLRALNEDEPFGATEENEGVPPWTFHTLGDTQKYNGADDGELQYAAVAIKSIHWPGATTICQNGKYANIYMGYGLKFGGVCFNPTKPDFINDDPDNKAEKPEPTPLEEPQEQPVAEGEAEPNTGE